MVNMKNNTFTIKIADTIILIEHQFPFVRLVCQDYITDEGSPFLTISTTEDEIRDALPFYKNIHTMGEMENLLVFLECLRSAYLFQMVPLHAAVIEYKGKGYAFSAASGVGKSTHVRLWREVFGESVHVINGDKPFLKALPAEDGSVQILAYGTPWCGKEGLQRKTSVPLAGLCFLERGRENAIRPCSYEEFVTHFFEHIPVPECDEEAGFYLQFADKLLSQVPVYVLQCNQTPDAALTAYRGMMQSIQY